MNKSLNEILEEQRSPENLQQIEQIGKIFPKSVIPQSLNILKFIMTVKPLEHYQITLIAEEIKGTWLKKLNDLGYSIVWQKKLNKLFLFQIRKFTT